MIRIEIETMKTAVSELQRKRAILSNIKERMAKLAYAVSQQSYVEETVCELRKLKKRMREIPMMTVAKPKTTCPMPMTAE